MQSLPQNFRFFPQTSDIRKKDDKHNKVILFYDKMHLLSIPFGDIASKTELSIMLSLPIFLVFLAGAQACLF
jgi:hypothetical protein